MDKSIDVTLQRFPRASLDLEKSQAFPLPIDVRFGQTENATGRKQMKRRNVIAAGTALLATPLIAKYRSARAADTPGVTATEIKIGHTIAYSGPASGYGVIGKLESAFWDMINEQGGVSGRKINFISLDE